MKRFWILLLCCGLLAGTAIGIYFRSQDGRVFADSQGCGVLLLKGGYRTWRISYSDGLAFDGSKWRNLWRWPQFHHVDIRNYLAANPWITITNSYVSNAVFTNYFLDQSTGYWRRWEGTP